MRMIDCDPNPCHTGYSFHLSSEDDRMSFSSGKHRLDDLFADTRKDLSLIYDSSPSSLNPKFESKAQYNHKIDSIFTSADQGLLQFNSSHSPEQSKRYKIQYLGSKCLEDSATRLKVLQAPLKTLYLDYINLLKLSQTCRIGTLEILESGLRIQYLDSNRAGVKEVFNSFPSIAVWAAIKLVIRQTGEGETEYAFLPLICDPESQDKHDLFNNLDDDRKNDLVNRKHPPMFACVMKNSFKILECHAFICPSAQDAIIMAANLYQALLDNIKLDNIYHVMNKTREEDSSDYEVIHPLQSVSDSEAPVRPPRRKKSNANKTGVVRKKSMSGGGTRVRRCVSERQSSTLGSDLGDIYTKVALPRSKSFMNVSTRYELKDLLREIKGDKVRSLDDVLKKVVKADGMSFTEMNPIYKEILLKMAVTLTKDEIYQRSKYIMRQQKRLYSDVEDGSTISGIVKATKRSLSRISTVSNFQSKAAFLKDRSPLKKLYSNKMKDRDKGMERLSHPSSESSSHNVVSECELDSECYSDRCYCPLNQVRPLASSVCDCDTDSCAESEKCYCSLRSARITDSRPTLGYKRRSNSIHTIECLTPRRDVRSSSSLVLNSQEIRRKSASSSLHCDNDLPSAKVQKSLSSDDLRSKQIPSNKTNSYGDTKSKILLVSAVDPLGKLVYRGASQNTQGKNGEETILSMKKTAEIAALFSAIHINQTTDIIDNDTSEEDVRVTKRRYSRTNLENSLGYLP